MRDRDFSLDEVPFGLDPELGTIRHSEQVCPGVYFLTVEKEGHILLREYYAVMETAEIILKVNSYGQQYPGFRLYSIDDPNSGWRVVEYETGKLLSKKGLPTRCGELLHTIAAAAAGYHPEYFGTFPAPIHTPCGYTLRYLTLENGIYWIETDQCETVLAIQYFIWDAELSDTVQAMGEQTEHDRQNGIHNTLGYLFFRQPAAAAAIYELMEVRAEWAGTVIDKQALANAIWEDLPEYAVLANWREQNGQNPTALLLKFVCGMDAEIPFDPKHTIAISSDMGKEYLLLK